MLGSPTGPGGPTQRGPWPLAPASACANSFTTDGFSKYGVYSLFPGGPSFGSALYTHASTIGRFASSHIQQPSGNPFHAAHKDSLFTPGYTFGALTPPPVSPYSSVPVSQLELYAKSCTSNIFIQQPEHLLSPNKEHFNSLFTPGYTFGALTPPPGSPYSPVPVSQLELFAKSFNSNIIIQQQPEYPLSPNKAPQLLEKRCDEKCCSGGGLRYQQQQPCSCPDLTPPHARTAKFAAVGDAISTTTAPRYPDNGGGKYSNCLLKLSDVGAQGKYPDSSGTGCSRTNPIEWNGVSVKKEPGTPCQVAEVSTSASPVVKVEVASPTQKTPGGQLEYVTGPLASTNGSHIPVGVAVARQRIQQNDIISSPSLPPVGLLTTVNAGSAQVKDVARISEIDSTSSPVGMAAASTVGGPTGGALLQCTDDRGAPLAGWPVGGTHSSALTAPTLWQYPASVPMEPMVPLPFPPVGLQLVREPTTGGFLLLPTATGIEPLQQTVVWPSYPQPPSVFIPPIPPPPLQLLSSASSDYLQTSTTLHQHTQTHSTRLVAVTTDSKRKIPLPIPTTTLIKIEADATNIDQAKALQTVNTGAVFTDQTMPPLVTTHVIYQHPTNLILSQTQQTSETVCKSQATSPVTCLTPPPECLVLPEEEPAVQDASNQTDTPICSEDDSTAHTICDVIGEAKAKVLEQAEPKVNGVIIKEYNASQTAVPDKIVELQIAETTTPAEEEVVVPDVVASEPENAEEPSTTEVDEVQNAVVAQSGTVDHDEASNQHEEEIQSEVVDGQAEDARLAEVTSSQPEPDLSGLELLSNSIVEYENRKSVELEYAESQSEGAIVQQTEIAKIEKLEGEQLVDMKCIINKAEDTSLGGLDLLCALAEQRILEEKIERPREKERLNVRERSSKERRREKRKSKRHHDEPKHKKSKFVHEKKEADSSDFTASLFEQVTTPNQPPTVCKCQEESFRSYKNPKSAQEVRKFIASKSQSSCDDDWPNMNAMELDMRMKLADLQRQYREKQKELSKLKPKKHSHECSKKRSRKKSMNSDRSTPPPVLEKITIPLKPHKTSNLIKPPTLKAFSDIEPKINLSKTNEKQSPEEIEYSPERSSSQKRKVGRPKKLPSSPGRHVTTETIVAKKPKKGNFVGYFLAAKEKYQMQNKFYTDSPPRYIEDTSLKPKVKKTKNNNIVLDKDTKMCKIRPKLKAELTIKTDYDSTNEEEPEEADSFEERMEEDMDIDEDLCKSVDEGLGEDDNVEGSVDDGVGDEDTMHEEVEEKVDNKCTLTAEHLEMDKLRVLTAMGGLFYAGQLNAVEPPDVYSITLDGERGNRPHIMSREEILRDAIVEISPKSTEDLPIGTRICAYWSQQYRCLYPGSVAEPGTPDPALDEKFVSVEFDDGDSGRIALEDIRLLPPNYPIIEYDPNPLQSLSKRRRRVSACTSIVPNEEKEKPKTQLVPSPVQSPNLMSDEKDIEKENKDINKQDIDSHKERKRLKKKKKEKLKQKLLHENKKRKKKHRCTDENCKHKKHHRKHRKHRKHHHSSVSVSEEVTESPKPADESIETSFEEIEESEEADSFDQEASVDQESSTSPETSVEPVADEEEAREEDDTVEELESQDDSQDSQDFDAANPEYEVTIDDVSEHKKIKKVRDRQESCDSRSKISAFLPAHLMWDWVGKEYKSIKGKGRHRKSFYRSIKRKKGETISVGDAAVFKSTGRPDRPYIGRIETMWECSNSMIVRVKWFYHPEETENASLKLKFPGALFESPHVDENDVQTISHKCNVLPFSKYVKRFGEDLLNYELIYENNDVYYLAGHYDPTSKVLSMEPGIPQVEG